MKLEIFEIKDRGLPEERIVLKVNEPCDIGRYFVFTTKVSSERKISIKVLDPFWFPDKEVKKGDLVVLYSKTGQSSFKVNEDQTTSHFYFRKSNGPILTDENIALLVEVTSWQPEPMVRG